MIIEEKRVDEALARIARTEDGRIFHLGLQRALMALAPSPDSGALQTFEGGRRFAAQIKAVMDKAIAEDTSARPDQSADASNARGIVVIAARGSVSTASSHRGPRRRVSADPGSNATGR